MIYSCIVCSLRESAIVVSEEVQYQLKVWTHLLIWMDVPKLLTGTVHGLFFVVCNPLSYCTWCMQYDRNPFNARVWIRFSQTAKSTAEVSV